MISRKWLKAMALSMVFSSTPSLVYGAIEIEFWHSMPGVLNETLTNITQTFNQSQDEYHVSLISKGPYSEAMTAAIAAVRAKAQPDIIQVHDIGTGTFLAAENVVYPVYQLMKAHNIPFNYADYLPAVINYYTDQNGNMISQPFNSSTVIAYYNLDIFEKAGLDISDLPETWEELAQAGRTILAKNAAECGFIATGGARINIENLSTWHNVALSSAENGYAGLDAVFEIDNPLVRHHWQNLLDWQKEGIFTYGGRGLTGTSAFRAGKCGAIIESSASVGELRKSANFRFAMRLMPYYPDFIKEPQNSIISGASLWVMRHKPESHYKGIAQYLNYLSSTDVQAEWSQKTGYLPATHGAFEKNIADGFYARDPGAKVGVTSVTLHSPTVNSRGLRYGNYTQIRTIFDEELELVLNGTKTVSHALKDAQSRANNELRKFERQQQR